MTIYTCAKCATREAGREGNLGYGGAPEGWTERAYQLPASAWCGEWSGWEEFEHFCQPCSAPKSGFFARFFGRTR